MPTASEINPLNTGSNGFSAAPVIQGIVGDPGNEQQFPKYDSLFGDESIFTNDDFIPYINFKKLIEAIVSYRNKVMPYNYREFESHATEVYVIDYGPVMGPYKRIVEKHSGEDIPEEDDGESTEGDSVMDNVKDLLDKMARELTDKLFPKHTERVNIPYLNDKGIRLRFEGLLNTIPGKVKIAKSAVGFVFELDASKWTMKFHDHFHYVDEQENPTTKTAISISARTFGEYLELCTLENLYLTEYSKKSIITKFAAEAKRAKDKPTNVAWLYTIMPDFVYLQMGKEQLINDLTSILKGNVRESYINEEAMVLKILSAFVTNNSTDQDLILNALENVLIGNESLFVVLYRKMNDLWGKANWTAAMQLIFKLWSRSKFSDSFTDESKSQPNDKNPQPEILGYQSKKILGFYNSGYDFSFKNNKIEVEKKRDAYMGEGAWGTEMAYFTTYDIFQPILLQEVDQAGELKILSKIPAFYLKAFDDKNEWENFKKTVWLIVDIATTFSGIGNIAKLRYLTKLSKLQRVLAILGTLQVASGTVGIILKFVNDCEDKSFCDKLQTYLLWFDFATMGADAITSIMLRKSAKAALDKADNVSRQTRNSKEYHEIVEHLDEASNIIDSYEDVYKLTYRRPRGLYTKLTRDVVIEKYGTHPGRLFDIVEREWDVQRKLLTTGNARMKKVLVSGMVDNQTGKVSKVFSNFTKEEIEKGLHLDFMKTLHPTLKKRLEIHLQKRGKNGSSLNLEDPSVIDFAWKELDIAHAEFRALDDILKKIDPKGISGEEAIKRITGYNSFLKSPGIQGTCADCFYLTHGVIFIKL